MLKKALLIATALASLTMASHADVFRIANYNSLITARHSDLVRFMQLNNAGRKSEVRNLYNYLAANRGLYNLQPGDTVNVLQYFRDGTAEIAWYNGADHAYIAQADLD
jgi:hypothetical protein